MKTIKHLVLASFLLIGLTAFKTQKPVTNDQTEIVAVDQPKSVDIRGEKIHFIEQGSGEPIILVHGTVGDYRVWASRMQPYSKDYHVVAYSRRYAFPNKKVFDESADYSVRVHADDLYALIQKLGFKKVHLVGHSYGAYTALTMALDYPEVVQSMVLGEPPAAPLLEKGEEGKASFDSFMDNNFRPVANAFRTNKNEEGVETFLKGVMGEGFSLNDVPPEVKQTWMDNVPELWGSSITESLLPLDPADITTLEVPVLLLVGDRSPGWFGAIANKLHLLLPDSELDIIENSSHGLYFENPVDADRAVMDFVGKY